jgi:uncharacterized membrane protein YecN with MAPEG domain
LQMALTASVALTRRRNRQSLGDGGDQGLLRAIRRHGNLAENGALFIAGFTLLELAGGNRFSLQILCAVFVLARISHAVGLSMDKTVNPLRLAGVLGTIGVGVALGVRLVLVAMSGLPM